jgi:hypothetical protein
MASHTVPLARAHYNVSAIALRWTARKPRDSASCLERIAQESSDPLPAGKAPHFAPVIEVGILRSAVEQIATIAFVQVAFRE